MRVFAHDLQQAEMALHFMRFVSLNEDERVGCHEAECAVHWALECCGNTVGCCQLNGDELLQQLVAHRLEIVAALNECIREWANLARAVAKRRGKIPTGQHAECGNAYFVANDLRESRDFLEAALQREYEAVSHA